MTQAGDTGVDPAGGHVPYYAHEVDGPECVQGSDSPDDHVRFDRLLCGCNVCWCGSLAWHDEGCVDSRRGVSPAPAASQGSGS